jgi:quinol monooxygenase YgiN
MKAFTRLDGLAAHFNTPHIAAWRAASADLKITDRKLALYEAGQPEPI